MLTLESLRELVRIHNGKVCKSDKVLKSLFKQGLIDEGGLTNKGKKLAGAAVTLLARLSKGVPITERARKNIQPVMPKYEFLKTGDIAIINKSLVWFGPLPIHRDTEEIPKDQFQSVVLFNAAINNRAGWTSIIPVEYRIVNETMFQMIGFKNTKGEIFYINAHYYDFLSQYVTDPRWFVVYKIPVQKENTTEDVILCAVKSKTGGRIIRAAVLTIRGVE